MKVTNVSCAIPYVFRWNDSRRYLNALTCHSALDSRSCVNPLFIPSALHNKSSPMADNKRNTIRHELPGDESPYLHPTSPTPPYQNLRNASSTGDLAHDRETPAELPPYSFSNLNGTDVKVQGNVEILPTHRLY